MTSPAGETSHIRLKAEGFPTAPLIEAVIDVHFAEPVNSAQLTQIRDALKEHYPDFHSGTRHSVIVDAQSVQLGDSESHYQGSGSDPTELSLLRPDGIATSQLAPYRDWPTLYGRFRRDLDTTFRVVGERPLARMAVRSVNRIDVPPQEGVLRYEEYIAVHPQLPAALDPLLDFQMLLVRSEPEIGAIARIKIGGFPPAMEGMGSFVVDIDLFKTDDIPTVQSDLDDLFSRFRDVKNRLYQQCLTPRALEDFK